MTPTRRRIGQIGTEARELAGRGRERKLRPEEYTGATFSVSNLGMLGIRQFAAIINPPEGAILAVGNVRKEPVVKDGKIVVGQRMSITLSCDHRVIDGALGAKLLQAIVRDPRERPISAGVLGPHGRQIRSGRRSAPGPAATSPRSAPRSSG